jgi:hypothetical protein
VQLVEIDHIDAEPPQARVARRADAVRRQAHAPGVGDLEAHLRGHHDLGSVTREPGRQDALRAAVLVDVGRVDQVAAGRQIAVEDALRLVRWRLAAHQHRTERQAADGQRAECRGLHGWITTS